MRKIRSASRFSIRFSGLILLLPALLLAGIASAQSVIQVTPTPANFAAANVGGNSTLVVTLTNPLSSTFDVIVGAGFSFTGIDASQFSIVPGGTCAPAGSVLLPGQSCTLNLRFAPTSGGNKLAQLIGSCSTLLSIGGVLVTCNATTQTFANVAAAAIAVVVETVARAIPTLGAHAISLLSLLMVGLASFHTLRRRG